MPAALLLLLLTIFSPLHSLQSDCTLPLQLVADQMGEVRFTDGTPLNVRSAAGRGNEVVGALNEGSRFNVTGGATCAGGINWWPIETNTVTGWIAEAADDVYFVRPVAPDVLAMEAEIAAAPVFDVANIDEDARLLILGGGFHQLLDSQLNLLLTLDIISRGDRFNGPVISGLNHDRSALVLMRAGADEILVAILPQIEGKDFIDAQVSPDGSYIAWLYSDCGSNFGCALGTGYVLSLTDVGGNNRLTLWFGMPNDVGRFRLAGWRRDSGAVFIEITDAAPYPEPGSPIYTDPGYPPEPDVFEISLNEDEVEAEYVTHATISDDGLWLVDRQFNANLLHAYQANGEVRFEVSYPGYWLAGQFTFSPDNSRLAWVETDYDDGNIDSVTLKTLDLSTGTVQEVYNFPAGYPFTRGWLSETLLYVRLFDMQWDVNYQLVQRERGALVFDLDTGAVSRLELPDGQTLLRVVPS